MLRLTFRNQILGLGLSATALLAVSCGQYFKATEHYSGQIEEALESVVSPAFYNVFVTPKGQDIFRLNYFLYNREAGSVVGLYKAVDPELAQRDYRYAPKMNRYTRENNGSIDGPGSLVYEIRIQAYEVIYEGGAPENGVRVEIPIENIESPTPVTPSASKFEGYGPRRVRVSFNYSGHGSVHQLTDH